MRCMHVPEASLRSRREWKAFVRCCWRGSICRAGREQNVSLCHLSYTYEIRNHHALPSYCVVRWSLPPAITLRYNYFWKVMQLLLNYFSAFMYTKHKANIIKEAPASLWHNAHILRFSRQIPSKISIFPSLYFPWVLVIGKHQQKKT